MTARRPVCDTHIRFSPEERRQLEDIARRECRTVQGQVLHYVRQMLKEEGQLGDALSEGERITRAVRRHVQ
jgi:hypothetical protein